MDNVLNYDDIAPIIGMLQLNNMNLIKMLRAKDEEIVSLRAQLSKSNGDVEEEIKKVKGRA